MDIDDIKYEIFKSRNELERLEVVKLGIDPMMDEFNSIVLEVNIEAEKLRSKINRAKKIAYDIKETKEYDKVIYIDDRRRIAKVLANNLIFDGYL